MKTPGHQSLAVGRWHVGRLSSWLFKVWRVCILTTKGLMFDLFETPANHQFNIKISDYFFSGLVAAGVAILWVFGIFLDVYTVLKHKGFWRRKLSAIGRCSRSFLNIRRVLLSGQVSCPEVVLSGVILTFFVMSQTNFLRAQEEKQDPTRGQGVNERNRSALDPLGIRAGGFLFFPKIELEEKFNSNVYAQASNEKSDFITVVSPSVEVKSDFNRHSLNLALRGDIGLHAKIDDENYQDLSASTNGRIDVITDLKVNLGAAISRNHELRSSPDDENSLEPTILSKSSANIGTVYKPNRISIGLDWKGEKFDYDDAINSAGVVINNDDRDKTEYTTSLRLGYDLFPEHEAFVRAEYNVRDFNDRVDDAGLNRDSDGYRLSAGTTIDLTGLIEGEFAVGYMSQKYDDSRFTAIAAPFVDAKIDWHLTGLTTLSGSVGRSTVDTTSLDSPGYIETKFQVSVEHELFRNQTLGAGINYNVSDYKGISREDNLLEISANTKVKINRNAFAGLGLTYRKNDSNLNTNDFDETTLSLRLGLQF